MAELFDICVAVLVWIARSLDITYKEANIWIFVIIEPIVFILMLIYIIILKRKIWKGQ